jgi:hypothetical protein
MPGIVAVPRSQAQAKARGTDSGDALNWGQAKSITDLAEQEGVTDAYVCRLLPLTCLAPDVLEAILDGRQPKGLRLAELLGNGPLVGMSSAAAAIFLKRSLLPAARSGRAPAATRALKRWPVSASVSPGYAT